MVHETVGLEPLLQGLGGQRYSYQIEKMMVLKSLPVRICVFVLDKTSGKHSKNKMRTWDVEICAKTFTTDGGPPTYGNHMSTYSTIHNL